MTDVMDPPTSTGNGNELATQQQPQQQIVQQRSTITNPAFGDRGIEIQCFEDLWKLACVIAKSPFAPKGMERAETIFVAIQLGLEVGMTPMASMQSIAVINGRPGIYGDAALALVRGSGLCDYYLEFPSDNTVHTLVDQLAVALEFEDRGLVRDIRQKIAAATAKLNRSGDDFGYSSISKRDGAVTSTVRRFTIGDAKKAGLWGKQGPWSQYSERMLMWRSRGFNLRDNFGDVLKGMYTAEEAQDMPAPLPGPAATVAASLPLNERLQQLKQSVVAAPGTPAAEQLAKLEQAEHVDTETGLVAEAAQEDAQQPAAPDESQESPQQQWEQFKDATYNLIGEQMDRTTFDRAVGSFVLGKLKKKQQAHELSEADRQELVKQVKGRLFGFAKGD